MHMGDDHVPDRIRVDPRGSQTIRHGCNKLATSSLAGIGAETGINHNRAILIADHPDKVIQRHGQIMAVTANEIFRCRTIMVAITNGQNFILVVHSCAPIPDYKRSRQ